MGTGNPDRFPMLAVTSGVAIYVLLLSGSYVTVSGATTACLEWPLCQVDVFPEYRLQMIHMAHRFVAAMIGLFAVYVLLLGFRGRHRPFNIRLLSMGVATLFVAQMLVGAAVVWAAFPVELRALHLALATAVWGTMAALAVLSLTGQHISRKEPAHA